MSEHDLAVAVHNLHEAARTVCRVAIYRTKAIEALQGTVDALDDAIARNKQEGKDEGAQT